MFNRLFRREPKPSGTMVLVRLNARAQPIDRGERYEDPLQDCDSNFVVEEFNRLLAGTGSVHSHWQGPTETALYVYGRKASDMQAALQPFLDSYPLC
jgi:hypothetical protein